MKHLTTKEEEIMKILWRHGAMTPRQVVDSFPSPAPHINTVATFLRILEQKGWVVKKPITGTHLYTYEAAMSESQAGNKSVKSIITRFFHGSVAGMVSSLLESEEITEEEMRDLIEMVKRKNSD